MDSVIVEQKDGRYILSIDKTIASDTVIQDFVAKLRFDELTTKASFALSELQSINEDIKKQWWDTNKEQILSRVHNYQP